MCGIVSPPRILCMTTLALAPNSLEVIFVNINRAYQIIAKLFRRNELSGILRVLQGKALKRPKNHVPRNSRFIYKLNFQQFAFENFHLPFGGKLDAVIPWHFAETMYAKNFLSKRGAPALTVRMALGTLIIKEKLAFRISRRSNRSRRTRISSTS